MPSPLRLGRFNHAALNVTDVDRSVAFYRDLLGLRTVARPQFSFAGAWLYSDGLGMMLHLIHDAAFDPPRERIETRKSHLAFRVDDVDTVADRLDELGLAYARRTLPDFGYRQLFFQDPDGNVLEVGEWPDVETLAERAPPA